MGKVFFRNSNRSFKMKDIQLRKSFVYRIVNSQQLRSFKEFYILGFLQLFGDL